MKNENEVAVVHASPAEMISAAVAKGADLDKLRGLLELQKEWEANEARKAYHKAMAAFKENAPQITKDKKVKYTTGSGVVSYAHASLSNVVEQISKELSKHGLAATWRTKQNGTISVTCVITHNMGHSEETTLSANADNSGSKNAIQALGSTISYLQRYTLLSATGLATSDMDDDGGAPVEYINNKELSILRDQLADLQKSEAKFAEYLGIENLEKLPKADYKKAQAAIDASKKKKDGK